MDSPSYNADVPEKQAASSIRNVLSSIFSRDRSAEAELAVLMSFKELPEGENLLPGGYHMANSETKQEDEDIHQDHVIGFCDTGPRAEMVAGTSGDPDLVQVTRVETYSDTENENEEASHGSSKRTVPEVDINNVEEGDQDELKEERDSECYVPVFRTHKLGRSRIENILSSERQRSRNESRTPLTSLISKHREGSCVPESRPTVSVDAECAAKHDSSNVGTDERDEYAGIYCSLPVPSIILGPAGQNAAMASPLNHTGDVNRPETEEKDEATTEFHPPSALSDLKTTEVLGQPACSQDERSDISDLANQTASVSVSQPNAHPCSQDTFAPKEPESDTLNTASSDGVCLTPSPSSPSRGGALSWPASFQMPALFSGLRVLKKGAAGEDRDKMSEIKQREKEADLALLSLKKSVNKTKLYPEQRPKPLTESKSPGTGQLNKKSDERQDGDENDKMVSENGEVVGEKSPGCPTRTPEKKTASDLAYETFKTVFGPKMGKKGKTEDVDLEALKRKIKNDKENIKSIFERVSRSPSKETKNPTEVNV